MCNIKKTIIVRLAGGLGNQIFQFGASLRLAHKNKYHSIVIDDESLSNYAASREMGLENFFDLSKYKVPIHRESKLINKLRLPKIIPLKYSKNPFVGDHNYRYIVKSNTSYFRVLDGYFQLSLTQVDFDIIVGEVGKLIIRKDCKNTLNDKNTCVMHIRGGDFVALGLNEFTDFDYYERSMDLMFDKHCIGAFIAVTDDVGYTTTLLQKSKHKVVIQSSGIVRDFFTIFKYSNRILSSSTFAFWASALGNNYDGCNVVTPCSLIDKNNRNFFLPNEL